MRDSKRIQWQCQPGRQCLLLGSKWYHLFGPWVHYQSLQQAVSRPKVSEGWSQLLKVLSKIRKFWERARRQKCAFLSRRPWPKYVRRNRAWIQQLWSPRKVLHKPPKHSEWPVHNLVHQSRSATFDGFETESAWQGQRHLYQYQQG